MTISQEPDGRISFRVLIGADCGRSARCDLIELIVSPTDISRALTHAHGGALADTALANIRATTEPPTFPCHIGLYRNAGHATASAS